VTAASAANEVCKIYDLYCALAGGGAGNWAGSLSATVKAYGDGLVAGARLGFTRTCGET